MAQLAGIVAIGGGEVPLDVLGGGFEDVQGVTELLELVARHHELVLGQAQLAGSTPGLVVALAARPPAELGWTPGAGQDLEPSPAPPAPPLSPGFRHCVEIYVG